MYIGGISYFSSGSGKRPLGGVCPEAAASPDSKSKQMEKLVLDTIKNLRLKKGDRISERTRGVDQIFSTQTGHGVLVNSQRPSESTVSRTANYANNADKWNRSTQRNQEHACLRSTMTGARSRIDARPLFNYSVKRIVGVRAAG